MTTSDPLSQGSDSYADRRLYVRTELALPAFLQSNGERHSVHLVDLSAGGAKLKCSANVCVGAEVVLDCGTLGRAAVVRWRNDELLGLCFDSPLEVREVAALIDRSRAVAARFRARE
jgi:hypothetical protein